MQSRVVAIRSRLFFSAARMRLPQWSRATSSCASVPGDTAVHSEDPQVAISTLHFLPFLGVTPSKETDWLLPLPPWWSVLCGPHYDGEGADEAAKASMAQEQQHPDKSREKRLLPPSSRTPYAPSPKLENSSVNPPMEPTFQQKRSCHAPATVVIDDFVCVGLDGMPVDVEQREEEDDNIAYYREHKPSPLSEIEFVDTRVPLRRVTDGGSDDDHVIGWREEQLDTAEAALLRAEAMFREAAERGDPDSPQARVLAAFKARELQL